jgi:hypothetical protein
MHAVLVTAYKDYPSLLRVVRRLDPGFFKLFIHVDRKSPIAGNQIDELERLGAKVAKTFTVRWGSYTHLQAILQLMRTAVDDGPFDYLHIISGQDYPLWDAAEFERRCNGPIFIDYGPLEEQPPFVRHRYELRDPFHFLLNDRFGSRPLHKFLTRKSGWIRQRIGKRRTQFGPYATLYKAPVWCSFPGWAAVQLLGDQAAAEFLAAIRNTRVAEEIFFPTYFMNSDMAAEVVKDDLRYTDWSERNGSNPAYLDESDVEAVLRSNALFARKVNSEMSARLLDAIDVTRFGRPVPGGVTQAAA